MPASLWPSWAEMLRFLPEIILTVAGTLIMMLEPVLGSRSRRGLGQFALAGLSAALAAAVVADGSPGPAFSNMLVVDGFATFFRVLVLAVGILTVCSSYPYLNREGASSGEYWALLLFSITGQCVMASANELIMVFIGIEISSISSYVLAGYLRDDKRANEAALKYFLLGSFATAFLLYGIALVYGAAKSTNLAVVRAAVEKGEAPLLLVGIAAALMFVGFAFKVSGAPFQMWAPDVYQGAPAPVSAFLSAGPKAAAFAVFLRVFMTAFQGVSDRWAPVVWISALLSMSIGNFAALRQSNLKRMLAYSSIAHAGYVLVAMAARSQSGSAAVMFYLAAYALMNMGAFAVVAHVAGKGERYVEIQDLAGLAQRQPLTAAALAVFLLSLIGVPLTGGFFGKFYIFKAALESRLIWLAVLGLLNSAVAAYYYLRILVVMYMEEPGEVTNGLGPLPLGLKAALAMPVVGLLVLGIFPSGLLDYAVKSAKFW
ncbi:MAG: NADH-quinone oxidoreductase subunit N [Acidobacteria bacterium]|nr:NADH-quinone oxidoreductase subunit N [Acidobacteriota bacterium]